MSEDTKSTIEEPETDESSPDSVELEKPIAKHKHRTLKITSIVIASFLVVVLLIAGWFGFVPGLSNVLGARTPKDLGVSWTQADLVSYEKKTGTTFNSFETAPPNPLKPGKKTIFADPKSVQGLELTQSEITAAINSLDWELQPLTNVQVRLTPGGVEVSGNLKLDRVADFVSFIGGVGYSSSDVDKAVGLGDFLNGAAFYAKGQASVTNNTLAFSLGQIQIGRFSPPADIASKVIFTGGSNGIDNTKYLDVKSATPGDGKLNFTGTYPTTIYVKH